MNAGIQAPGAKGASEALKNARIGGCARALPHDEKHVLRRPLLMGVFTSAVLGKYYKVYIDTLQNEDDTVAQNTRNPLSKLRIRTTGMYRTAYGCTLRFVRVFALIVGACNGFLDYEDSVVCWANDSD